MTVIYPDREARRSAEVLQLPGADFDFSDSMSFSVLGRATAGFIIDASAFEGDMTLRRLSNTDLYTHRRNRKILVRPGSQHGSIILAVLNVTHPEETQDPKFQLHVTTLMDHFGQIDTTDHGVDDELERLYAKLHDESPTPDLLQGICAYAEATQEMYGGIYEDFLMRPASLMATWMIAYEMNEPLE